MTATLDSAPVRAPSTRRAAPLTAVRLLRIELRRNAMPWILPLIAALFWFDSYRPSADQPPYWILKTFWNMGQGHTIIDTGPFVAGVAAWMASREARSGMADLVAGLARPRWVSQLVTWAATAVWAVAAYLLFVGVLFAVYASQGIHGSPPWWWVAVGASAVTAFTAFGFAIGTLIRSRFAAPLAAFGGFLAMMLSSQTGFSHTSGWPLILPTNSNGNYQQDTGIFYHYLPDLPLARILFLTGIAVALLGLIGLPAGSGSRRLRGIAVSITVIGVVAAGSAVGLASTARLSPDGIAIPALHDAANDRQISYTPICRDTAGIPVCLNPAYRRYLPDVTAALKPVLLTWAGLPGAPTRVTQIAASYSSDDQASGQALTLTGKPTVLNVPLGGLNLPGSFSSTTAQITDQLRLLAIHAFVIPGPGAGTTAQQAVQAVILHAAGGVAFAHQPLTLSQLGLPSWAQTTVITTSGESGAGPGRATGLVYNAAKRLAALSAASLHAWLAGHLAALRAGDLSLAQLP